MTTDVPSHSFGASSHHKDLLAAEAALDKGHDGIERAVARQVFVPGLRRKPAVSGLGCCVEQGSAKRGKGGMARDIPSQKSTNLCLAGVRASRQSRIIAILEKGVSSSCAGKRSGKGRFDTFGWDTADGRKGGAQAPSDKQKPVKLRVRICHGPFPQPAARAN